MQHARLHSIDRIFLASSKRDQTPASLREIDGAEQKNSIRQRQMSSLPHINVWAQWLSDHSLAVTLVLALFALLSEAAGRTVSTQSRTSQSTTRQWASTWLTNAALLACAIAVSLSLGPWLSPWFSDALSGKSGLLVWLGFDRGASVAHVVVGIFLLDLIAYALHRVMHFVPLLWRLHQVHHSDTVMNASTHFRQHPLAMIATIAMQVPLLWLMGIPAISWVLYLVLASAVELWHHSAMRLPVSLDRWLGIVVVTPQFHRTHHNQARKFHDANYSSVFPLWDRLFGTAALAPLSAPLGLTRWKPTQNAGVISVDACLLMPLRPLIAPIAQSLTRPVGKPTVRDNQKLHTNNRGNT